MFAFRSRKRNRSNSIDPSAILDSFFFFPRKKEESKKLNVTSPLIRVTHKELTFRFLVLVFSFALFFNTPFEKSVVTLSDCETNFLLVTGRRDI